MSIDYFCINLIKKDIYNRINNNVMRRISKAVITLLMMTVSLQTFAQFVTEYKTPEGQSYLLDTDRKTALFTGLDNAGASLVIPACVQIDGTSYTVVATDIQTGNISDSFNNVISLTVPSSMQNMGAGSASLFPNLKELHIEAVVPPIIGYGKDERVLYVPEDTVPFCKLYVPSISLDLYEADSCWQTFVDMVPVNAVPAALYIADSIEITANTTINVDKTVLGAHMMNDLYGHLTLAGAGFHTGSLSLFYNRAYDYYYAASDDKRTYDASLLVKADASADNAVIEMSLVPESWAFISLPYDIKVSDIEYPDSAAMVIRRYDGSARAKSDYTGTWKDLTADSTLHASCGYIIQVRNCSQAPLTDYNSPISIKFPVAGTQAAGGLFAKGDVTVTLHDYPSEFKQNRAWNLVGNPYPCCFDLKYTDYSGTYYVWDSETASFKELSTRYDDYILLPGESFFIQAPKDKQSITFHADGRMHCKTRPASSADQAKKASKRAKPVIVRSGINTDWNPANPGDPGCNLWNAELGRVMIDYYQNGYLGDAIDNAIGLTVGKTFMDETVTEVRGRVKEIVVAGPFITDDISAFKAYPNCKVLDLSRTTGLAKIPSGAFEESTLGTIILPESVDTIDYSAFRSYTGLEAIHLYSPMPPYVDKDAFDSIPKGCAVYVSASTYPLYLVNKFWSQLNIKPFTDQISSLKVSLPQDWTDGRYQGMRVQVTSNEYGHTTGFLITDKQTYLFNNLIKDGSYKVELKRNDGITLSRIDEVIVAGKDIKVNLPDVIKMHSLTARIYTPQGSDITGACQVTWYADGTLLGNSYQLQNITEGTALDYTVILPEKYALEYMLPDTLFHVTTGTADTLLVHRLADIPKITLSGIVIDAATGQPVNGARIVTVCTMTGRYSKSFTAQSATDGTFSMSVLSSAATVRVMADGYFDNAVTLESTQTGPVSLAVSRLTGQKVRVETTYTTAGNDDYPFVMTRGYSDMSDLKYSFYSEEKEKELTGYIIQYPDIWFVTDTISATDRINAVITSRKGIFDPVEASFSIQGGGNDTLFVDIRERGYLIAGYEKSDNKYFNVQLFNSDGVKINGGQTTGKEMAFYNLEQGHYTVIASSGKNGNISVARLEQFESLGLEADVDYVSMPVYITSGLIETVQFEKLPELNMTGRKYLLSNSFESDKVKVYNGDYTSLTCRFDLRPDLAGKLKDTYAVIDLPRGCSYVNGSARLNGAQNNADVVARGQAYSIYIPIDGQSLSNEIRLSVIPTLSGTAEFSASISFYEDLAKRSVLIGDASVKVVGITVNAQSMTIRDTISISGTAPANASVLVYDGDALIASTTATLANSWFVRAGLNDAKVMSYHRIHAKVQSENGWVDTDTTKCLYNPYGVYNAGILMEIYSPNVKIDVCEVYDARQRGEKRIPRTATGYRPTINNIYNPLMTGPSNNVVRRAGTLVQGYNYDQFVTEFAGAGVYFDFERGEAEPYYNLGATATYVYKFQAYFPGCDSTEVQDVQFTILLEDSTKNTLPAHFVEPGHWEGARAYSSEGALPINITQISYTPNKPLPYDSVGVRQTISEYQAFETDYLSTKQRLQELKQTAFEIESKENITPQDQAHLQQCLNEALSLVQTSGLSYEFNEEQLAYINSLRGLEYEEIIRAFKNIPGVEISDELIEFVLGNENSIPLYGTIEPRELATGYYSPRVTYNFNYADNFAELLNPDNGWKIEFSENNTVMTLSDSNGNYMKFEDMNYPKSASLLASSRGDGYKLKDYSPSHEEVMSGMDIAGNINTGTGLGASILESGSHILVNGEMGSFYKSIGLASAEKAASALGNVAGGLGMVMDGKAAWDALSRENSGDWLAMGRQNQDVMGVDFLMQTEQIGEALSNWNQAVALGHIALATIGAISMVAFTACPPVGLLIGVLSAIGGYLLDKQDQKFQAESANLLARWQSVIDKKRANDSKPNRDPSGFVCEAVESNRLAGVTATVYHKYMAQDVYGEWHEIVEPWDAELYEQVNPQQTDDEGFYGWDVPEGLWQVRFEKDGYVSDTTDWLIVPPPQLDVNMALTSYAIPDVTGVKAYEKGINIAFSKYMRTATLTADNIMVIHNGTAIPGTIELLDNEWGFSADEEFASRIRFVPTDTSFPAGSEITLILSNHLESYAGVALENGFVQDFTVVREIEYLSAPEYIELRIGQTETITIEAEPAVASNGQKAVINNSAQQIVSISADTLVFDTLGTASLSIKGTSLGETTINVILPDFELMGVITVDVLPDSLFPAPPYASIESGQAVAAGTTVRLLSDSTIYYIWYTLDGSDPLLKDNPGTMLYEDPIVIDTATTIIAVVQVDNRFSYPATFTYTVEQGSSVSAGKADLVPDNLYDLKGRKIDDAPDQRPYINGNRIELRTNKVHK